ncbi:14203_t:CDS:1, partial [Acaulospora morrowiae]
SLLCENRIEEYDALRIRMEITTETSISSQQLPPLTILDAINFAAEAWNRVKPRVIQSSWHKSGILPPTVQSPYSMANETEENLESEVINLVKQLPLEESMIAVREYINLEEETYN